MCVCVQVWQALVRAERTCSDLQRATSMLEGRLAELSHWGTEALEVHQHLEERKPGREAKVRTHYLLTTIIVSIHYSVPLHFLFLHVAA